MWLSMEFYAWTLLVISGVWFACYCYVSLTDNGE